MQTAPPRKPAGLFMRWPLKHNPNTLWPTSFADWLVILILAGLLIALLWPAMGSSG
jgi:hypothetical protein